MVIYQKPYQHFKRYTVQDFLPRNATEKAQTLDSSVISEFNRKGREKWDNEQKGRIELGHFSIASGKVLHRNRHIYMTLATKCGNNIKNLVDDDALLLP